MLNEFYDKVFEPQIKDSSPVCINYTTPEAVFYKTPLLIGYKLATRGPETPPLGYATLQFGQLKDTWVREFLTPL